VYTCAMGDFRTGKMQNLGDLLRQRNIVLKGADVLSAQGFTQVPNHVLRSDKVSPGAKLAYAMLLSYAWQNDFCFPGQETLASDMGVSSRSVRTYLKELESKRFLTIQQQGQGRVNIYHLDLQQKQPKPNPLSRGHRKNFPVKNGNPFRSGAEIFSD
jgi:hypothetical protein